MARTKKLTPRVLRRIIAEESAKLNETLEMGLKHPSEAPMRINMQTLWKHAWTIIKCAVLKKKKS